MSSQLTTYSVPIYLNTSKSLSWQPHNPDVLARFAAVMATGVCAAWLAAGCTGPIARRCLPAGVSGKQNALSCLSSLGGRAPSRGTSAAVAKCMCPKVHNFFCDPAIRQEPPWLAAVCYDAAAGSSACTWPPTFPPPACLQPCTDTNNEPTSFAISRSAKRVAQTHFAFSSFILWEYKLYGGACSNFIADLVLISLCQPTPAKHKLPANMFVLRNGTSFLI